MRANHLDIKIFFYQPYAAWRERPVTRRIGTEIWVSTLFCQRRDAGEVLSPRKVEPHLNLFFFVPTTRPQWERTKLHLRRSKAA